MQSPSPAYRNEVHERQARTRRLVLTGLLLALTFVFSYIESLIPPPPLPVPAHYGLANVVVMYTIFFVGTKEAIAVSTLKVVYAMLVRGMLAGWLSLAGTLLALIVLIVIKRLGRGKFSLLLTSVMSAAAHSIGQLWASRMIFNALSIRLLIPPFIILAIVSGIATALILRAALPALRKVRHQL